MVLVVGLGNPGTKYTGTRHNAGFLVVEALAAKLGANWKKNARARAHIAEVNVEGKKVILAKPETFMNDSGQAVASLVAAFKITPGNVWITYDDVAIPLGSLRVRTNGSAGGHNGIKSIIESLGTDAFARFRVGINLPPEAVPLEAYVLQKFSPEEAEMVQKVIVTTVEKIIESLHSGVVETSVEAA